MAKVVLCIHGRSPKPPETVLLNGCRSAILEGLNKNCQTGLGGAVADMAYYSDIFYPPLTLDQDDEPYIPAQAGALKKATGKVFHKLRGWFESIFDTPFDWLDKRTQVPSKLAGALSKKAMADYTAYMQTPGVQAAVQQRLLDKIVLHRADEIILVAHSMGSIVAYEALRRLSAEPAFLGITVAHFITLGSPLGLTAVRSGVAETRGEKLRTPAAVAISWTNFSDPSDLVCFDSHLKDDYKANDLGVRVSDIVVANDYPDNPHKMYGYLRTPEFSELLEQILV